MKNIKYYEVQQTDTDLDRFEWLLKNYDDTGIDKGAWHTKQILAELIEPGGWKNITRLLNLLILFGQGRKGLKISKNQSVSPS